MTISSANTWVAVAQRVVEGLMVQPGELIQVRDHIDRPEIVQEMLLAIDRAGATPLLDHQSPAYLNRWLAETTPAAIEQSSRHRLRWLEQVDRVVSFTGGIPDFDRARPETLAAWERMDEALTAIEEARQIPILVVAAPNEQRATRLGMALSELESHVLAAHLFDIDACRHEIELARLAAAGDHIVIGTGEDCKLHLYRGDRVWHGDDGVIDDEDRRRKSIVSNLPAGSIYTTVLEARTHGSLYLPTAPAATKVTLHFEEGKIVRIDAADGADELSAWLDSYGGDARRVSHIGVGLNPHLRRPIGWPIVDEHIAGALFLALGENRYMGGQNASSLNYDFALHDASLHVDGRTLVERGRLVV